MASFGEIGVSTTPSPYLQLHVHLLLRFVIIFVSIKCCKIVSIVEAVVKEICCEVNTQVRHRNTEPCFHGHMNHTTPGAVMRPADGDNQIHAIVLLWFRIKSTVTLLLLSCLLHRSSILSLRSSSPKDLPRVLCGVTILTYTFASVSVSPV